jgi:hypothetical protein
MFSFSEGAGVFSITSGTPLNVFVFDVGTDAEGQYRLLESAISTTPPIDGFTCRDTTGSFECLGSSNFGDFPAYGVDLDSPSQVFGGGFNNGVPGSWSVPEPASQSCWEVDCLEPWQESVRSERNSKRKVAGAKRFEYQHSGSPSCNPSNEANDLRG